MKCRTCSAEILLVPVGESNQRITLNSAPSPFGNVRVENNRAELLGAGVSIQARENGEELREQNSCGRVA